MQGMCGRYALTMEPETLYGLFEAEPDTRAGGLDGLYGGDPVRPRYNIAPTLTVPVVRLEPRVAPGEAARQIEPMRWGLVPSWAKDISVGSRMFNARAESLGEKAAFRTALAKRRCLIPASGYFEWMALHGQVPVVAAGGNATRARKGRPKVVKQPFYMTPQDGSVMAFAGLWEYWRPADGEPVVSMTIITTDSVGPLRQIHDRMPLILPASEWSAWLDPRVDPQPMLAPPADGLVAALELRTVGGLVGNVANDDPSLVDRVAPISLPIPADTLPAEQEPTLI
jgi:putative SOS response-associated peptidase YedK